MKDSSHVRDYDEAVMRDVERLLRKERPEELARWLAERLPAMATDQIPDLSQGIAGRLASMEEREAVAALLSGSLAAPDELDQLAQLLDTFGLEQAATAAFRAVAALESLDDSLLEVWGGPFNGQSVRQELFQSLVSRLGVASIVETGTFRGSSTAFMASQSGLPLFTCEASPRYFHYSSRRLAGLPNVTLRNQDSRLFLKELLDSGTLPPGPVLFYLDAHWHNDLPVWEEIDIIFSRNVPAVIVIDDFRVPGDPGFSYDDYGAGKCLSVQDLRENSGSEADWFFPHGSSASESGRKRGCAVLARGEQAARIVQEVPALDRLDWRTAVLLDAVTAEIPALRSSNAQLQATNAQLLTDHQKLRAEFEHRELQLRNEAARQELQFRAEVARQELQLRALDNGLRERDQKIATLEQTLAEQRDVFARIDHTAGDSAVRAQELESRVRELQSSRWRRIGLRLRLAKPATFER